MNENEKQFFLILITTTLILGIITTYYSVNHQQTLDQQILSGNIHVINTQGSNVEPNFQEKYQLNKQKIGNYDYVSIPSNLSSSNITSKDWNDIVNYIVSIYNNYDAFIIIMNGDNLTTTACAVSFMIENLNKPIVFTENNIVDTLILTSQTQIPEVMISSNNMLLRSTRTVRISPNEFISPNYPSLEPQFALNYPTEQTNVKLINPQVMVSIVKLYPGIDEKYMNSIMENNGIILEVWGEGNAPTSENFLKSLAEITKKGVIIIVVSQCIKINPIYDINIQLTDAGCINGGNMTTSAAFAKLSYLLSNIQDKNMIKQMISMNFRGEIN